MRILQTSRSFSTLLTRLPICQCRWIKSPDTLDLKIQVLSSPVLVQEPPAVYLNKYKRRTSVYQRHLHQHDHGIYRAATITVRKQPDNHLILSLSWYATPGEVIDWLHRLKSLHLHRLWTLGWAEWWRPWRKTDSTTTPSSSSPRTMEAAVGHLPFTLGEGGRRLFWREVCEVLGGCTALT